MGKIVQVANNANDGENLENIQQELLFSKFIAQCSENMKKVLLQVGIFPKVVLKN